jgi:hypothetical protein
MPATIGPGSDDTAHHKLHGQCRFPCGLKSHNQSMAGSRRPRWTGWGISRRDFGDSVCFLGISETAGSFGLKRTAQRLTFWRVVDTLISRGAWPLEWGYAG